MISPDARANPGGPLKPSAGAWNTLLDGESTAQRSRVRGASAGTPSSTISPSTTAVIRNDSGADRSTGDILKITNAVSMTPYNLLDCNSRPVLSGDTPGATSDVVAILAEPIKYHATNKQFGKAVITGLVTCTVNITDTSHAFATPTASDATKLTSVASGPIKIIAKESAGTGNKECMVLLQDIRTPGASGGGSIAVATATQTTKAFGSGAATVGGQVGKLIELQTSGSGTASLVQTTTVFLVSTNNATDAFSLSTAAASGGGYTSKNTTFYEVVYSGVNADDGTPIYVGQGDAGVITSAGDTNRTIQGGSFGIKLDQTLVGNKTFVPYVVPFAGNLASASIVFNGTYEAEFVLLPATGTTYAAAPVALNLGGWKIAPYSGGGGLSSYTQIDPCYLNSCVVDYDLKVWDGAAVNNTYDGSVVVGDGAGGTKTLTFVGGLLTTVV
jgi:hypothetical protein